MQQHLYFLGIGGTLMGSLALLAKDLGHTVSGSDGKIYPPMSDLLAAANITVHEGFSPEQLEPSPDLVIVGNANLPRGSEAIEHVLNKGLRYTSGAQWLGDTVLHDRWVIAVTGTHGKTSTASMVAWILDYAGMSPGYLIGGAPANFETSARLGETPFFVVEADEYDTSYFDRRSKFVHYRPRTLVINNLEYDHADIFPDLAAIETQFHHLVRCIPAEGLIIRGDGAAIDRVLERGVWSPTVTVQASGDDGWSWRALSAQADKLEISAPDGAVASLQWPLIGAHNAANATAAIAAAGHVGISLEDAVSALATFKGVKRRLELLGKPGDIAVYDDFAHHPTAIESTLLALRAQTVAGKLIALIEPRSNTMRMGEHREQLAAAAGAADHTLWFEPVEMSWELGSAVGAAPGQEVFHSIDTMIDRTLALATPGDNIVVMSNGGFGGLHRQLMTELEARVRA